MVGWLKDWIINICTAVFFITAVEMILPDNNLKKYAKFVLGIILMIVIINPILKLYNGNFNIDLYTNKAVQYINGKQGTVGVENNNELSDDAVLNNFKANLEKNCGNYLKERYPDGTYTVSMEVSYDKDKNKISITSVKVGVKDNSVEPVKKVEINTKSTSSDSTDILQDKKSEDIIDYLSGELDVPKNIIVVYKIK